MRTFHTKKIFAKIISIITIIIINSNIFYLS